MYINIDDPHEVRNTIRVLEGRLLELQGSCKHKCAPSNPEDIGSSHPVCVICGWRGYEWYCPESPNGRCEYEHPYGYNHDSCIHCGEPDERK